MPSSKLDEKTKIPKILQVSEVRSERAAVRTGQRTFINILKTVEGPKKVPHQVDGQTSVATERYLRANIRASKR